MNNDLTDFFGGVPFSPATVEPATDFDVYPPGKYSVLIEAAEVKPTKTGTGHILKLTMQILDGEYKGRKLFDNINLQNPSAQCVEIGMRTLSALGRALSIAAITDTTQLLKGVVIAHVKAQDGRNNVRTYSTVTNPVPPMLAAIQEPMPQSPVTANSYTPPAPAQAPQPIPVASMQSSPQKRPWE